MSADNWARCPRCAPADESYQQHTLREDWEVGFESAEGPDDGYLIYTAKCDRCGASLKVNQVLSLGPSMRPTP